MEGTVQRCLRRTLGASTLQSVGSCPRTWYAIWAWFIYDSLTLGGMRCRCNPIWKANGTRFQRSTLPPIH
eukprot:scaffold938_cov334-Pavlova_lutheri.AAC.23